MYWDIKFFSEFDRPYLQNLGAHAGHFQHFIIGDKIQFFSPGTNVRICCIDSIYISEDLAHIRVQGGGQGNGRRIRAPSTQCGYIPPFIKPLEAFIMRLVSTSFILALP